MVLLICVYSKNAPAISLRLESSERFRMLSYFKEFEYSED